MVEFFSKCRDVLRRERNSQNDAEQASFDKSYKDSLKYVETHKASIAYDMACDWEEHKFRCKQHEIEQALENRNQRTERLIELGKSYRPPAVERCSEKDEPNKSAQQSPDSGGEKPKTNWGLLFAIYGDKPFIVRPEDPYTNLFPDDPDRIYNRNDFDIDRD